VARSPEKAELLRRLGATPVTLDLFDAVAVRDAVAGHDAVINLATHIPSLTRAAKPGAWAENDRIRTQASTNLVDAAIAAHASRFVQESITMAYADGGDRWLDESTPHGDNPYAASVQTAEANAQRFTEAGGAGVVLRFSMFYGAEAGSTTSQLELARRGIAPSFGRPDGYQSMIHLHDAATAVVASLRVPSGVYNVAEDQPCTRKEQAAAVAAAIGSPPLWQLPAALAKAAGKKAASVTSSHRVTNRAFRAATGWAPVYPDQWSGWAEVAGPTTPPSTTSGQRLFVKASLVFLAVQAALIGVWATVAPLSWYRSFPGGGRHWVEIDGPYNHHLVTDTGALFLALTIVTLVALGSRSRAMMRTAGGAWAVSALPHFLYHATHRAGLGSGDLVASVGGLALQVVLGVAIVILAPAQVLPRRPLPVGESEELGRVRSGGVAVGPA
jgi:nucleoside-diphosphate-sugar epimerase